VRVCCVDCSPGCPQANNEHVTVLDADPEEQEEQEQMQDDTSAFEEQHEQGEEHKQNDNGSEAQQQQQEVDAEEVSLPAQSPCAPAATCSMGRSLMTCYLLLALCASLFHLICCSGSNTPTTTGIWTTHARSMQSTRRRTIRLVEAMMESQSHY
jgi:hypothetical protein